MTETEIVLEPIALCLTDKGDNMNSESDNESLNTATNKSVNTVMDETSLDATESNHHSL